jgi:hypothetical protein
MELNNNFSLLFLLNNIIGTYIQGAQQSPHKNHLKTQKHNDKNRNTEFEIGFQMALDPHKALTHSGRGKKAKTQRRQQQ